MMTRSKNADRIGDLFERDAHGLIQRLTDERPHFLQHRSTAHASNKAFNMSYGDGPAAYGRSRRITEPMPLSRPPPPKGTITVSTPGRSSIISAPIVAFPATTADSATGWKNTPSTPAMRRVVN